MSESSRWGLFDVFGIELEYMIVSGDDLSVAPICDRLMQLAASGEMTSDIEHGDVSWSNELALHVLEMKTTDPAIEPSGMLESFQREIHLANSLLHSLGARLMPTAMHPWMDPHREMQLWPHENNPVYQAFDRIFNCRGHGWANLQSTHWNLPFRGDEEFARLHAATRLVLPLLPALAASSPIVERRITGMLDNRLDVYRGNSRRIPSITGHIVPEPVFSESEYDREIFQRMYQDIAPFDPDGTLQHIWLNSRGAIARFDRGSIEIRVLDIQECPAADLAIGLIVVNTLKALCQEQWSSTVEQQSLTTEALAETLDATIRSGPHAIVPRQLAKHFGWTSSINPTARDLWCHLFDWQLRQGESPPPKLVQPLEVILNKGTLSERILSAIGNDQSPGKLQSVYGQLADCLEQGVMFGGA